MNNFQEKLIEFLEKYNRNMGGGFIIPEETANKSVFLTKYRTDFNTFYKIIENPNNYNVDAVLNGFYQSWTEAASRLRRDPLWFREIRLFLVSLVFIELCGVLQTEEQRSIYNYVIYLVGLFLNHLRIWGSTIM